jgi:peroxiredoxin
MKKQHLISFMCVLAAAMAGMAQRTSLPDVPLYTLDGKEISASSISNEGMPLIMTFWKTTENDCCEQLIQLNNTYEQILRYQGVKMVAVCIDCSGTVQHVKPFVFGHNLTIDVYVDKNGDFKRAMGVSEAPYTVMFDHQMEFYCKQSGPCGSIEDLVCQKVNEYLTAMNEKK